MAGAGVVVVSSIILGVAVVFAAPDLTRLVASRPTRLIVAHAERQATDRRGKGMVRAGDAAEIEVASPDPTASRVVSAREVLQKAWGRLSSDERWLAEQRALDRPWAELAAELGTTPEALRKKHTRALDRVANELGLDAILALSRCAETIDLNRNPLTP